MRIGEVHSLLRKDVPDIELSKIRYYEDKGLVQPTRSRKGYRLYSERDVACLREAIRLANEEFVPLRVVRLRLIEQGLLKDVPVQSAPRQVARSNASSVVSMAAPTGQNESTQVVNHPAATRARAVSTAQSPRPIASADDEFLTTSQFLQVCGLEASSVNQLVSMGILTPVSVANETAFSARDLRIANCAAALIERGADVRLLGSLRRVVEREIGILEDLTEPLRSSASTMGAAEAAATAEVVAGEVHALREELLARALRGYLGR